MGLAGKMKRKFSLQSMQLKTNGSQQDMRDYDTDSPPYSPTPSEMERPSFHPQTMFDLRQACAVLVNQTNPPDPEDEPDHRETMKRFEAERKAKYVAQARAAEAKSQKAELREVKARPKKEEEVEVKKEAPKTHAPIRPQQNVRDPAPKPAVYQPTTTAYQHVPRHAAQGFGTTAGAGQRRPSESHSATAIVGEPVESAPPQQLSSKAQGKQKEVEDPTLHEIRQSIHVRPKTSAAATVDYVGNHSDSSRSTSRSTSQHASHRPTSTGMTSLALTPGEEKRRSHNRRPSDDSYREELARKEAEAWMREKLAQQQSDQQPAVNGPPARPASRSSRLSRMTSRGDNDRPPSRAGSLAGSIADSISNYIRPRASSDNMRSGRSSAMSDRSRSSSTSRSSVSGAGGFFRRNSLRRKGSWASFRSGKAGRDEEPLKNGEPNLNRPLPALPGLDSYKETKTHIGQLMKGGQKKPVKKKHIGDPQPLVAPQTLYTATLPKQITPIVDRQTEIENEIERRQQYAPNQIHPPVDQARRSTLPKNMASQQPPNDQRIPAKRSSSIPNFAFPRKSSDLRSDTLSKTSSNVSNPRSPILTGGTNKLHANPPVVRGPSWHEEVQAGVYPRPMDVGNGSSAFASGNYYNVKLVDVGRDTRNEPPSGGKGLGLGGDTEMTSPRSLREGFDVASQGPMSPRQEEQGSWEKKRGLKGRVGRMFGSSGNNHRAVAAN